MAYMEQIEAKSTINGEQKVVGSGQIEVYETVQEAVDALGAERVLSYTNRQNKINELNKIRAAATSKPSIPKVLRDRLAALDETGRKQAAELLGIDFDELQEALAE